jgi:hypothetical protein
MKFFHFFLVEKYFNKLDLRKRIQKFWLLEGKTTIPSLNRFYLDRLGRTKNKICIY